MYIQYRQEDTTLLMDGNVPFDEIWRTLDTYVALKGQSDFTSFVFLEIANENHLTSATIGVISLVLQDLVDSGVEVKLKNGDKAMCDLFDTMVTCCYKQKPIDHIKLCA